ncbi:MAG TPA: hypothetical protein VGN36_03660 [Sphingorhabdus sp.]|nr:hypothetical protein [Sphingorhabdus sp.]
MDNSSRNIVQFIATVTMAALVLMAANYYAQSQEAKPDSVDPMQSAVVAEDIPEEEMPSDENSAEDDEIRASDTEVVVEDPEGISGNPSAVIQE